MRAKIFSTTLASCLLEISRAGVCISPATQSPSPKLETTRSLDLWVDSWGYRQRVGT